MVVLIRRRINDLISELKLFQCWPPSHISRQCAGLLFQFLAVVGVLFEDTEQFSNSFAEDIGKLSEQDLQPACFSACFSLVFFFQRILNRPLGNLCIKIRSLQKKEKRFF